MTSISSAPHLPAALRPPSRGYLELFLEHCHRAPNAPAWRNADTGKTTSYRELERLALRVRGSLRACGVTEGDFILVTLPSGPELVATFFAVTSLRAVAVVVSDTLTPFELQPLLEDVQVRGVVWMDGELRHDIAKARGLAFALCLGGAGCGASSGVRLAKLDDAPSSDERLEIPSGETTVSCHATYKDLGVPLGVLHKYRDYSFVLERTMARLPDFREAGCLSAVSHVPIYGLINAALLPLVTGGHVLQVGDVNRSDVFELMRRHDVRFLPLVPLLLRILAGRAEVERRNGKPLQALLGPQTRIVVGGSHADTALLERAQEQLGVQAWQGYGTTETLIISSEHVKAQRPGTLGVTDLDAAALRIVDARGREVQTGALGELHVASVAMTEGYVHRPSETARFLAGGWFRTGDLGSLDEQGYLHYRGRRLGFTKIASQMVDLQEVRRAFAEHPDVEDTRVAVHADRLGLNHLTVAVRLRATSVVGPADLKEFAAVRLSSHKLPRRIEIANRSRTGTR